MISIRKNFFCLIGVAFVSLNMVLLANASTNTIKTKSNVSSKQKVDESGGDCFIGNKIIAANFEQAKTLFRAKLYDKAFVLYQTNKQLLQKIFGANDLSIAYCDINMALIRYKQKQDGQATAFYKKAMSLTTNIVGATQTKRLQELITFGPAPLAAVLALNDEAVEAMSQNKPLAAIEKLKEAIKLAPDYNLARENLSIAYNDYGLTLKSDRKLLLKQMEKALFYCRNNDTSIENLSGCIKLIGKNPQSAKDRIELGDEALQENDPERAVVEYSEAIKIDPASLTPSHAYFVASSLSLAFYYGTKGETNWAIALLLHALQNMGPQATAEHAITSILLRDCCRCIPLPMLCQRYTHLGDVLEDKDFANLSPADHIQVLRKWAAYNRHLGDMAMDEACADYVVMAADGKKLKNNDCNRSTADCLFDAATFWDEQKRYKEAAPVLSDAIEKYLYFGWVDNDLKKYISSSESHVRPMWHPPKEAAATKCTIISFRVYRDGFIDKIKVMESCGNIALDKSALIALKAASPLPLLPVGSPSPSSADSQFTFKRVSQELTPVTNKDISSIRSHMETYSQRVYPNPAHNEKSILNGQSPFIDDFQRIKKSMSNEQILRQTGSNVRVGF